MKMLILYYKVETQIFNRKYNLKKRVLQFKATRVNHLHQKYCKKILSFFIEEETAMQA